MRGFLCPHVRRSCITVDVHRDADVRVSHQFLLHAYRSTDRIQPSAMSVAPSQPIDNAVVVIDGSRPTRKEFCLKLALMKGSSPGAVEENRGPRMTDPGRHRISLPSRALLPHRHLPRGDGLKSSAATLYRLGRPRISLRPLSSPSVPHHLYRGPKSRRRNLKAPPAPIAQALHVPARVARRELGPLFPSVLVREHRSLLRTLRRGHRSSHACSAHPWVPHHLYRGPNFERSARAHRTCSALGTTEWRAQHSKARLRTWRGR